MNPADRIKRIIAFDKAEAIAFEAEQDVYDAINDPNVKASTVADKTALARMAQRFLTKARDNLTHLLLDTK